MKYTLAQINKEIKDAKRELYSPMNRRANGKPLASVAHLQIEIPRLKAIKCELENHPRAWSDGYCFCRKVKFK